MGRWASYLKQQSLITVYHLLTKETNFRFPFPFAEVAASVFRLSNSGNMETLRHGHAVVRRPCQNSLTIPLNNEDTFCFLCVHGQYQYLHNYFLACNVSIEL